MDHRPKMQMPTGGAAFDRDRLWRITGPGFCCGLREYNDEITAYAPLLKELFRPHVHYGGNAYYVLNQARGRGYEVEDLSERRDRDRDQKPRMRLRTRRKGKGAGPFDYGTRPRLRGLDQPDD